MTTKNSTEAPVLGSAFSLLGKSADIVKKHWKLFFVVNLFTILFSLGNISGNKPATNPDGTSEWTKDLNNLTGGEWTTLLVVILAVVSVCLFFYVMMLSLSVKASKGKVKDFSDLVSDGKKYFFPILGQTILSGLIIAVGLILLIIPGLFAIQRLLMAPYVLVNENLGVIASMKRSASLARENSDAVWSVFGVVILVTIFCALLGIIPFLGVIASIVLSIAWSLIIPLRYLQLKNL